MLSCLIVDDNPIDYMVLRNQVRKLGLSSEICTDGLQALNYCKTHLLPSLILLDGYMPEMDGVTFLKAFRKLPGAVKTKVIFCSSVVDKAVVEEALQEGASCHFPKPLPQAELARIVQGLRAEAAMLKTYRQA